MSPQKLVFGLVLALAASSGQAAITGKLNDTGVVICANAESNVVGCSYPDSDTAGFPRQDGQIGRSAKEQVKGVGPATAQLPKTGTGASWSKGFDFEKIAYTGTPTTAVTVVPATTLQGITTTTWGCTRDNVTGLIWDMKVATASNARLSTNTYTWKQSGGNNGGNSGTTGDVAGTTCFSSVCDTENYIAYINTLQICGESANDWRLPTRAELLSIADATPNRFEVVKAGVTGTSGESTITVPDASGLAPGMAVTGDNIRPNNIIVSISGTTVTVSHTNNGGISGNVTFKHLAAVDPTYFPHLRIGNYYWTSDSNPDNPAEARFVNFAYGVDGVAAKGDTLHVILVRTQ